jgi:UDP-2-acetamido-3-amino-2,3-dideoxy-glucuronate N-acetyltransferase
MFVHKSSIVEETARIGDGTKVWHFCHVDSDAVIGDNCVLGQNVYVGKGVKIGDNVKIQNNVSVFTGVEIGDDVFIGPSAVFTNVLMPRAFQKGEFKKTLVMKGATIGANATIVCGTIIGRYSFVGAGSVVTKSIHDYAVVYGVPARVKAWTDKTTGVMIDASDNP